jgi:HK97 gp10 family phage protein
MGMGDGLMAKMTVNAGADYALKLSRLGKDSAEIAKKVVMAGASPVANEIRKNLEANLAGSKHSNGDLIASFGVAPPDIDDRGNTNTKIGFEGYDSKGVANALKARAMESGTSTQKKKPFVRPAVNKMRGRAIDEMGKKLDEEIKIYGL